MVRRQTLLCKCACVCPRVPATWTHAAAAERMPWKRKCMTDRAWRGSVAALAGRTCDDSHVGVLLLARPRPSGPACRAEPIGLRIDSALYNSCTPPMRAAHRLAASMAVPPASRCSQPQWPITWLNRQIAALVCSATFGNLRGPSGRASGKGWHPRRRRRVTFPASAAGAAAETLEPCGGRARLIGAVLLEAWPEATGNIIAVLGGGSKARGLARGPRRPPVPSSTPSTGR